MERVLYFCSLPLVWTKKKPILSGIQYQQDDSGLGPCEKIGSYIKQNIPTLHRCSFCRERKWVARYVSLW